MFNSSFSLRQNIKAVDSELGEYKVSNDTRVDILETFKDSLTGTAEGSIADLQALHVGQAISIVTLQNNATTLKARIDSFNNALGEDAEDGAVSVIEQIKLNKDGLASEIVDRTSEITRVEGLISAEVLERLVQDTVNTNNIIAETTARTAADTAEETARIAGDAAEASARQTAIEKVGFILIGETEGLLSIDTYPFCFGNGSPQAAGFGVSVPFRAQLKNLSLVTNTTDIDFLVKIQMIHYSYSTNIATLLGVEYSFQTSKQTQINITTPGNGHIVFKVTFIRGGTDDDRFRLSLVFSGDENLFLT